MSARPGLTVRQAEVLEAIRQLTVADVGPSLKEIAAHIGVTSLSTVHVHVEHLRVKGYVQTQWNKTRSIRAVDRPAHSTLATGEVARLRHLARSLEVSPEVLEAPDRFDAPEWTWADQHRYATALNEIADALDPGAKETR